MPVAEAAFLFKNCRVESCGKGKRFDRMPAALLVETHAFCAPSCLFGVNCVHARADQSNARRLAGLGGSSAWSLFEGGSSGTESTGRSCFAHYYSDHKKLGIVILRLAAQRQCSRKKLVLLSAP